MKDEMCYLSQPIIDLKARVVALESEVRALRDALSIAEYGPQGIEPIGPGYPRHGEDKDG